MVSRCLAIQTHKRILASFWMSAQQVQCCVFALKPKDGRGHVPIIVCNYYVHVCMTWLLLTPKIGKKTPTFHQRLSSSAMTETLWLRNVHQKDRRSETFRGQQLKTLWWIGMMTLSTLSPPQMESQTLSFLSYLLLLMEKKILHQLRLVVYSIIYKVLFIHPS